MTELDQADGSAAAISFKSPADALAWQQWIGNANQTVNVYAKDGTAVIGTFTIAGLATQQEETAEQARK